MAILEWVVSVCEIQEATGNMFLVENPVGATSWKQSSIKRLRSAPFVSEEISYLCTFGVKDPRSPRALKRPVRKLTNSPQILKFVVRKCPTKHVHGPVKGLTNAYRHTRAWAQAVIRGVESDALRWHEAYPPEDVEMDLTGHTRLRNHMLKRRLFPHPSKALLCRASRIGGANKIESTE